MAPLQEIDLNVVPGMDLTPSKRTKIVGLALGGHIPGEISEATKIPESTIRDTINKDPARTKGYSTLGRGIKKTYNHVFVRNLLRFVRTELKATY